ncbi:MAG: hypothetical protein LUC34_02200 [Campylobacter sp.]|nr:hypothetical protein [Campylobacter sp.]
MGEFEVLETVPHLTVELLTAADKLGAVGILVMFVLYLIYNQKQLSKAQQDLVNRFIDEEKARGDRIEKLLQASNSHNEVLKEILIAFRTTTRDEIKEIKTDLKEVKDSVFDLNRKFA